MFIETVDCFDELARVVKHCAVDDMGDNEGGESLAVADDRIGGLAREVTDQVDPSIDVFKLSERLANVPFYAFTRHFGHDTVYHLVMAAHNLRVFG